MFGFWGKGRLGFGWGVLGRGEVGQHDLGWDGGGAFHEVAEVVGLKGIVVAGAERSPRLDPLRNAARVRPREPLAPVGDERLLFTAGATTARANSFARPQLKLALQSEPDLSSRR